jgi:class 3 adenylate cyclase
MRKAFSNYLSPHLVKRIATSEFELGLGGKEVEATILFTDLEGFTPMAESLPPAQVSEILVTYFNRITTHILDHEGTIIKYVGDSVMAVWGAPLADARQAERAVLAACGIAEASQQPFGGRHLRTRIGINSGRALAGNLGSFFRFDYTVIGATTNLAARLEALNKPLGTDILISAATRAKLPATIPTRYLGQFILRGTTQATGIYEVPLTVSPTVAVFEKALHACESGDLTSAKVLFEQIAEQDRPAAFYLSQLNTLQSIPKPFVLELS